MDDDIDLQHYESIITLLTRGSTKRINHDDCPAGQDRKRRLYITRLAGSGNLVVAYCHNCSNRGVFTNPTTWMPYRDFGASVKSILPEGDGFTVPSGLVLDPSDWPTEAQTWRIAKKISVTQCVAIGISYDPSTHRIYLPQWDVLTQNLATSSSTLIGYQLRKLSGEGPKYLTAQKDKSITMSTLMLPFTRPYSYTFGCIVEDLASGIAMSQAFEDTMYRAFITVNYGTRVSPEVLYLNKKFDFGVVWLDNDSPHIKCQAEKIAKVWAMLSGTPIQIERKCADPKSVNDHDMLYAITRHWNQSCG